MHSPSGALEECYVTEIDQGEALSPPGRPALLAGSRLRVQKEGTASVSSQDGAPSPAPLSQATLSQLVTQAIGDVARRPWLLGSPSTLKYHAVATGKDSLSAARPFSHGHGTCAQAWGHLGGERSPVGFISQPSPALPSCVT